MRKLDTISIETAAALIAEELQYSHLAARLKRISSTIARSRPATGALRPQCHHGFRTCLPLRGSPGFSPDSLLILLAKKPWIDHYILWSIHSQHYPLCTSPSFEGWRQRSDFPLLQGY